MHVIGPLLTARKMHVIGVERIWLKPDVPERHKGAARMAFTDHEIAEAHEAVRRQSDSDNLYKLGLIYSTGQELDLVQAHMWFNLAASRGSEAAKECRRELSDMMSKDLISEAQRRAREWLSVKHH
jgi:TPR repeat protein